MCGISVQVNDKFMLLEDLNHASSVALRHWSGKALVESRSEARDEYQVVEKDRRQTDEGHRLTAFGGRQEGEGLEAPVAVQRLDGQPVAP